MLTNKHFILGITGGIAAYKSAVLARLLIKQHARVSVVMTEGAKKFIAPLTFEALTNEAVHDDLWLAKSSASSSIAHINISREADAMLIAPCTANVIAKLANGMADDLLTNLALARNPNQCPLIVAPAMNTQMWLNPATQRNLQQLREDGIIILGPDHGEQACMEVGMGRMLEPEDIIKAMPTAFTPAVLQGQKLVITAGPTFEAIDPVRGITNRSSGKMGYALAYAAMHAGAHVTLISGPVQLQPPKGMHIIHVQSALQMNQAAQQASADADIFIAVAAVADWRVDQVAEHKIKKQHDSDTPTLRFVQNPDILAGIAQLPNKPFCVGFAAESENIIENGQIKLVKKGIDLLIANNGPATFGSDTNQVTLIDRQGVTTLDNMDKAQLAAVIIQQISQRLHNA